ERCLSVGLRGGNWARREGWRVGRHAFADPLQGQTTVRSHRESMRLLQGRHAFAARVAGSLSLIRSAKAWHPTARLRPAGIAFLPSAPTMVGRNALTSQA